MNEAEKLINRLYGNIGFTCDVCGRKVNGCSIVNGMKFCAKCYQETFGKDNQQNEIQQLKQQLEEKDKEIERLKNLFELNNEVVINQGKEIFDLRVQVLQQKQNQTQLAIQELEKVKNYFIEECEDGDGIKTEDRVIKKDIYEVADFIENQIKELKGNNDEPRQSN